MRFYVYEHWRPDKDTCFWVGKGKGGRARIFRRNSRYDRVVDKLARLGMCVEVRMVAESLDEMEAFRIERERIAFWRLQGDDLCNMTDGGEGPVGWRHPKSVRAKMSKKAKGRTVSDATRAKMSAARKGRKVSPETRAKIAVARTGRSYGPHTAEHKAKIAAAQLGRKDSEAVREKKRAASLSRPPISKTTRDKISGKISALWKSQEYRARLTASHSQRPPISEPTRAKMRAAQAARRKTELEGAG